MNSILGIWEQSRQRYKGGKDTQKFLQFFNKNDSILILVLFKFLCRRNTVCLNFLVKQNKQTTIKKLGTQDIFVNFDSSPSVLVYVRLNEVKVW